MTSIAENQDHEANQSEVTFEGFCEEWLREFRESDLSSFAKGKGFAFKLVTQCLSVSDDDEDLVLCDGSGDGGIDIAYLRRADIDNTEQDSQFDEGDTWYLIQSKYGTAFQGQDTIISEGLKVIRTLSGENSHLSEKVSQLMGRLNTFLQQASERDRIVLVFATEKPISESDRQALHKIRSLGRESLSSMFDVEDMSLYTIWEARDTEEPSPISLSIQGDFVDPSSGLRVGTVSLTNLYHFLSAYRDKTGNLDQLYERNVRKFLGGKGKINKGIAETLESSPELFGLYNNGITIVVSDFSTKSDESCVLFNPYVVNGCQTTKTIWSILQKYLDSGGTGQSEDVMKWRADADRGVVVTKIVKSDEAQIDNITTFTNSQNSIRAQDFLALRGDFRSWSIAMAKRRSIYLEIQRGGWDSQKHFQQAHPSSQQFAEFANAFDLIKVYSAGWLREPGTAFGKNSPFIPGMGSIFKRITSGEDSFGVDDLYVAYRLQKLSCQFKFGRGAEEISRRQTRFLFYFVVIDFLREALIRANRPYSASKLTDALLRLLEAVNQDALQLLLNSAIGVVDVYLNQESEDSLYKEPTFQGDLNTFLKWEQLGKEDGDTPFLKSLLAAHKHFFGLLIPSQQYSARALVIQAIG